jgi:uncharacterized membrane protein YhaH (DUF805 family)
MFKSPFSFHGRICKTEYGISLIMYALAAIMITLIAESGEGPQIIFVFYVPLIWLFPALAAKRSHDVDCSGWYQLIPFYIVYLLFIDGIPGVNRYGDDPRHPGDLNQERMTAVKTS